MSPSESEYYELGMSLPPSVRREVALRLLESTEATADEAVDDAWSSEIMSRIDDIRSGRVKTIAGEQVLANLAARRAARHASRNA